MFLDFNIGKKDDMNSQLIVDKQSKQQHNLSDTRICCISYFTLDI